MKTQAKAINAESGRALAKQAELPKKRRVLMNTPMLKYVIYDDPTRFDKDMTTGEGEY